MDSRLKQYIKDNFDISGLRKAGVIPKEVKSTDYEKIAEIICRIFSFESIYEYSRLAIQDINDSGVCIDGKFADTVDKDGKVKRGGGFHLSMAEFDYDFECPICTCKNTATISTSTMSATKKCKGCKRRVYIKIEKGEATITEL